MNLEILIAAILFSTFTFGQQKQERETRIDKHLLPNFTQNFVNDLPEQTKRLRFYKEVDGEKESFEIKFKYNGDYYSAEFDTNGKLEDIEKLIKRKTIPSLILNEIESYFKAHFKKSKLLKIQQQFLPNSENNSSVFLTSIFNKQTQAKPNYEIIVEVTKGKNRTLKEFLFDDSGTFLNMRDIARSSYGHVLY